MSWRRAGGFWSYFTTLSVVDADIQVPVVLLLALLSPSINILSASLGLRLESKTPSMTARGEVLCVGVHFGMIFLLLLLLLENFFRGFSSPMSVSHFAKFFVSFFVELVGLRYLKECHPT